MEFGSNDPAGSHSQVEAKTVELPVRTVCRNCGRENGTRDAFCTGCGHSLPVGLEGPADTKPTGAATEAIPNLRTRGRLARLRSRRAAAVAVAVIAAGAFAVLWIIQMQHAHRLTRELASEQVALNQTRTHLNRTLHRLSSATALSRRRRAVLLQAQTVLTKVNPLLSSVDGVQSRAGTLQSDAQALSSDSASLIQTMLTLSNYLVNQNNSGASWDVSYVNSLADQVNSQLAVVRSDATEVDAAGGGYNRASTSFGDKANSFSSSVIDLQKQLQAATSH
jgi:hypothetical protein